MHSSVTARTRARPQGLEAEAAGILMQLQQYNIFYENASNESNASKAFRHFYGSPWRVISKNAIIILIRI